MPSFNLPANQVVYIGPVPVWEIPGSAVESLERDGLRNTAIRKFLVDDGNVFALNATIRGGGAITNSGYTFFQTLFYPRYPWLAYERHEFLEGIPDSIDGLYNNIVNGYNLLGYRYRQFNIYFRALEYQEGVMTGQVNVSGGVEELDIPPEIGTFVLADGTALATPAKINIPTAAITYTLKAVPIIPFVLIPFQQYVNTQPIFGLAAGTVKFDTFHSGNQTLIQNPIPGANPPWQYNWDIDLQFLFNGAGWNKMLTPAGTHIGTFQNVYYNDGSFSHQPFPTTDLNVLLQMPALTNPWVPPPPVNSINYQQPPGI